MSLKTKHHNIPKYTSCWCCLWQETYQDVAPIIYYLVHFSFLSLITTTLFRNVAWQRIFKLSFLGQPKDMLHKMKFHLLHQTVIFPIDPSHVKYLWKASPRIISQAGIIFKSIYFNMVNRHIQFRIMGTMIVILLENVLTSNHENNLYFSLTDFIQNNLNRHKIWFHFYMTEYKTIMHNIWRIVLQIHLK